MRKTHIIVAAVMLSTSTVAFAADAPEQSPTPEQFEAMAPLPANAVVLSGSSTQVHQAVLNALLDTRDLHFQDPGVPRYLLIDKEGSTVLGIGGYVEGVAMGDFKGAIDDNGFVTYDIPIPSDPSMRRRFGADMSHTTIFLKLVRNTRLGILNAYVQTNFTGDNGGYGLKLKQAYVTLGNVTMGLTNSTFSDPSAGIPTIDYQGPSGQVGCKNILLRYRVDFAKGWTFAVSAENPKSTLRAVNDQQKDVSQSVPDFPAYFQYEWGTGSHVRASALLRNLSYRDLVDGRTRYKTGYGVQLSGIFDISKIVDIYYQGAYGRGIAHYVNDLDGTGYDLIGSATKPGEVIAPRTFSLVAGAQWNITDKLFISGSYSFNRLCDQGSIGPDAYRRGNYVVANLFYSPISDLQLGVEYLHGTRKNFSLQHDNANRVELMAKYSF